MRTDAEGTFQGGPVWADPQVIYIKNRHQADKSTITLLKNYRAKANQIDVKLT